MPISLGWSPQKLTVVLTPSSTFAATLTNEAGNWPVGTSVKLTFDVPDPGSDIEWAAALSGADATWTVAPTGVDAVLAAKPTKVRLWYSDGTSPVEWGYGDVKVKP